MFARLENLERERQQMALRLEREQAERERFANENERLLARLDAGVPKLAPT